MKDGLLLVRVPYAKRFLQNRRLTDRFSVTLMTNVKENNTPGLNGFYHVRDDQTATIGPLVTQIVRERDITHAVVLTPYSEYGEETAKTLLRLRVPFLWSEVFPGGKILFDRLGCQYTEKNEIETFEAIVPVIDPELPIGTRFPQPDRCPAAELSGRYGNRAVAVFGQVPTDNSLKNQSGRLPYYEWLDLLIRKNPDTTFVFKHHPASSANPKALTVGIEAYPNVKVMSESVDSMFEAFKGCAAYGSTTILEGVSRGTPFLTGGRHFMDSPALVVRADTEVGTDNVLDRLLGFKPEPAALRRRLSFLTRHYAMNPLDERVLDRILLSSEDFFGGVPCKNS